MNGVMNVDLKRILESMARSLARVATSYEAWVLLQKRIEDRLRREADLAREERVAARVAAREEDEA